MKNLEKKSEAGEQRVLILEDNPADAELVEHELRRAKIVFTSLLVQGKNDFVRALNDFQPQVILSDFKLPDFDGQAALAVARAQAPDIPFIFVSGSIGEEKAIDLLSQGATDYIFKDNLARLGPAVKRAFAASSLKLEKKATDAELLRRVEEQRILAEAADRFVHINDLDTIYEYLSRMIREISGADYLWLSQYDESRQALQPRIISGFEPFRETLRERFDFDPARMVLYLKDMRPDDFNNFVARRLLPVGEGLYGLSNRNISRPLSRAIEQLLGSDTIFAMGFSWENLLFGGLTIFFKKDNALKNGSTVEALVNLAAVAIKRLLAEKSLRESERMFATLVANLPGFIYRCRNDQNWTMEYISAGCREITGYSPEDFIANRKLAFNDIIHPDFKEKVWDLLQQQLPRHEPFAFEYRIRTAAGAERWVWERGQGVFAEDGSLKFLEGFITDVTARRQAEDQLRESEMKYRALVTQSPDGIFIIGLGGDFLSVNQTMCASLDYSEAEFLAMNIRDIIPERYLDLHRQRLAEIMKGKTQDAAAEYEVKARNGDIHCIAILSAPYYEDNELIGFQGIARDITEKKKMEIRLRESEEYYRTLVKTSPDAIIIVDAGGRVTFCSDKTLDLFGIPPGTDIVGVSIFAFVEPAEVSRVQERMVEILSGRSLPGIHEYRLQRQDRRPFWGEVSSAPLHDDKGRDIGLLLVCRDISERKRSEAALSESEERYRLIADNTAETISVLDRNLRFTYISPSIFKLRGFTVEEALKQTLEETLTRDSLARIRNVFQEEMALEMSGTADLKRNRSLELQEFCKDGSIVWVENSLSFLRDSQGKPIGFLAVSKDISERKLAEREKQKLLDIIEKSLNEIYLFDSTTLKFEYVNQGALRNIGYSLAEMKELTPLAIKPRYGEAEFRELLQPLISGKKDKLVVTTIHQRKDGSHYPVEIHLQLFKQESKSVFFAVINDISERMRAEEQIRYQAGLLLNVSDAIISTDKNNIIQIWNHAAERIYGWTKEEAAGKSFHDLIKPEYRYQRREEVVETLEREGFWSGELVHHLHNGRQIPVQSSITILKDATGKATGTVSVNHNISERKAAEEQIHASLKEKEVLLQEIHHRVKNNLQIISGLLTLQADQAADRPLAEVFRESQDRIRSIALIHEKLYRSHNLAEIAFDEYLRALTENLFISHSVASGRIAAKFEMESVLFSIEKAIPLGLIVNELVTNALKHAFADGRTGEIRIGLRFCKEARFVGVRTESGTLYRSSLCELTIADNGIGMPTDRASEKEGKLGMKLVAMLAQQLQAELQVKSSPGTEFRLVFPGSLNTKNSKNKIAPEGD